MSARPTAGPIGRARISLRALETAARLTRPDPTGLSRPPSAVDLDALRGWSGWGPLAPALEPDRTGTWAELGERIEELLTSEEYVQAQQATYSAFYTPPEITAAAWRILTGLGFTEGRILEPGCGAGAFMASAPPEVTASWLGVERDPTTARIAQLLHPDATIIAQPMEQAKIPRHGVDAVLGNVPFGDVPVFDPLAPKEVRENLHGYMIWRSVQALRPGGVAVLVSSRYTLDAVGGLALRQAIGWETDLLGAIRLPNAALEAGGTSTVTDLLVLRRNRTGEPLPPANWHHTRVTSFGEHVNSFFVARPELVLGTMTEDRAPQFGRTLRVDRDADAPPLSEALTAAADTIVLEATAAGRHWQVDPQPEQLTHQLVERADGRKEGSFHLTESGAVTKVVDGQLERVARPGPEIRALIGLRDATLALLEAEADHARPDATLAPLRLRLNAAYDRYRAKYGPLNRATIVEGAPDPETGLKTITRRRPRMGGFRADPDYATVLALEEYDDDTGEARKAAIFRQRVNRLVIRPDRADDPDHAIALCLDELGRLDLPTIGRLLQIDVGDVAGVLGDRVYFDPSAGQWVTAAEYQSGNVRAKLATVSVLAADDDRWARNVTALEAVLPAELGPEEIRANLGAPWIPAADVRAFLAATLGSDQVAVSYEPITSAWKVEPSYGAASTPAATAEWGTDRINAYDLVEKLLNGRAPVIYDTIERDGKEVRVRNVPATMAAEERGRGLAARFGEWVWEDPDRADRLAADYNQRFNSVVPRSYDGSYLTFPGLAADFTPYQHQRDMVARMLHVGTALCGHDVGAGKTATMFMAAMTMRRLGLTQKPLIIVPNHLLEQITRDGKRLYPGARILMAGKEDLADKTARKLFAARCATGDWDAVVMTHNAFVSIPVHPRTEAGYLDDLAAEYRGLLAARGEGEERSPHIKQIAKMVDTLQTRARHLLDHATDDGVFFEQLGVTYTLVDEAHYFKNLAVPCRTFPTPASKRATDLDLKLGWLRERYDRISTLFTGTPVSNTLLELYVLQHYLQPEQLEEMGVGNADAWAATFVRFETKVEVAPDGGSFRLHRRPSVFVNLPELVTVLSTVADIRPADTLPIKRPEKILRNVVTPRSDARAAYVAELGNRADKIRGGAVDRDQDNMLLVCSDGRKAALDLALVDLEDDGPGKVDGVVTDVAAVYRATRELALPGDEKTGTRGGLQVVFCDLGTPNADRGAQVYGKIRDGLIDAGVPGDRIRFIHDAKSDAAKSELFAACRRGEVSVLLGSTDKLGVGTNIQTRLTTLHDVDPPWKPAELQQRHGRGDRPGNLNPRIEIVRHIAEGTFDSYMWQGLERKARFIAQLYRGQVTDREVADVDDVTLDAGTAKALATGNPMLLELAEVDAQLAQLRSLATSHTRSTRRLLSQAEASDREADRLRSSIAWRESVRAILAGAHDQRWYDGPRSLEGTPGQAIATDDLPGRLGALVQAAATRGHRHGDLRWRGLAIAFAGAGSGKDRQVYAELSDPASGDSIGDVRINPAWGKVGQHWRISAAILREVIEGTSDSALDNLRASIDELTQRAAQARELAARPFDRLGEMAAAQQRRTQIENAMRDDATGAELQAALDGGTADIGTGTAAAAVIDQGTAVTDQITEPAADPGRGAAPVTGELPDTPAMLPEQHRVRRGHDFYPRGSELDRIPRLYATDSVPNEDKILYLHYFGGAIDIWVAELDPETGDAYGYVNLGDPANAEWGYSSLPELESINRGLLIIERDLHWTPIRARDAALPGHRAPAPEPAAQLEPDPQPAAAETAPSEPSEGVDQQTLLQAVREHALAHYNDGGWDVVVEALDDDALAEIIGDARTPEEAIAAVAEPVDVWADRQADADQERAAARDPEPAIAAAAAPPDEITQDGEPNVPAPEPPTPAAAPPPETAATAVEPADVRADVPAAAVDSPAIESADAGAIEPDYTPEQRAVTAELTADRGEPWSTRREWRLRVFARLSAEDYATLPPEAQDALVADLQDLRTSPALRERASARHLLTRWTQAPTGLNEYQLQAVNAPCLPPSSHDDVLAPDRLTRYGRLTAAEFLALSPDQREDIVADLRELASNDLPVTARGGPARHVRVARDLLRRVGPGLTVPEYRSNARRTKRNIVGYWLNPGDQVDRRRNDVVTVDRVGLDGNVYLVGGGTLPDGSRRYWLRTAGPEPAAPPQAVPPPVPTATLAGVPATPAIQPPTAGPASPEEPAATAAEEPQHLGPAARLPAARPPAVVAVVDVVDQAVDEITELLGELGDGLRAQADTVKAALAGRSAPAERATVLRHLTEMLTEVAEDYRGAPDITEPAARALEALRTLAPPIVTVDLPPEPAPPADAPTEHDDAPDTGGLPVPLEVWHRLDELADQIEDDAQRYLETGGLAGLDPETVVARVREYQALLDEHGDALTVDPGTLGSGDYVRVTGLTASADDQATQIRSGWIRRVEGLHEPGQPPLYRVELDTRPDGSQRSTVLVGPAALTQPASRVLLIPQPETPRWYEYVSLRALAERAHTTRLTGDPAHAEEAHLALFAALRPVPARRTVRLADITPGDYLGVAGYDVRGNPIFEHGLVESVTADITAALVRPNGAVDPQRVRGRTITLATPRRDDPHSRALIHVPEEVPAVQLPPPRAATESEPDNSSPPVEPADRRALVQAVKDHALAHYEDGGWDVVVETFTDDEIAEAIGDASTPEEAVAAFGPRISVWAERQADADREIAAATGQQPQPHRELTPDAAPAPASDPAPAGDPVPTSTAMTPPPATMPQEPAPGTFSPSSTGSSPGAMRPTEQQIAIIDACTSGQNLVIEAGAGTGKTSTLRLAAAAMPRKRGLYVAYNKAIALEASASFPDTVTCKTMHSLAYGAVGRDYRHRLSGTDGRRKRIPASTAAQLMGIRTDHEVTTDLVLTPTQLARMVLATVNRFCHTADSSLRASHIAGIPGVDAAGMAQLRAVILPLATAAWDDIQDKHGQLPFSHDNYLKIWALSEPSLNADYILYDEAQDADPVAAAVVQQQTGAQLIAVGDSCQAIYGWRGAIDALKDWPADQRLFLSQSWRFGPAVAAEANKWLSVLDAPLRLTGAPTRESRITDVDAPDAILCRTNAEAIAQAIHAMDVGRSIALVGGGDTIQGLAKAALDLQEGRRTAHPELTAFRTWGQVRDYVRNDESGADLAVFVRLVDDHGPRALIDAVDKLEAKESRADVVISTAHKAKGREWDRVRIAGDFTEPTVGDSRTPAPIPRSDAMLAYVAVTRGRVELDRGSLAWIDGRVDFAAALNPAPEQTVARPGPERVDVAGPLPSSPSAAPPAAGQEPPSESAAAETAAQAARTTAVAHPASTANQTSFAFGPKAGRTAPQHSETPVGPAPQLDLFDLQPITDPPPVPRQRPGQPVRHQGDAR